MNYGLYLSASGVLTNMYRQDVFANNLANVETAGFKPDVHGIRQRQPESVEAHLGGDVNNRLLDRLGGGALAGPQRIGFVPGPPQQTGRDLDAMLRSPDTFFAVTKTDPGSGQAQVFLTRDGRFSLDAQGYLVTATGGHRVLDGGDRPIQIPPGASVVIDASGRLIQNGQDIGRVQVTAVSDNRLLVKSGQNLFRFGDGKDHRTEATDAGVRPGFIEGSAVDPIQAMLRVTEATKAVTSNGNMIRYHDLIMDRAVNVLGRVVA